MCVTAMGLLVQPMTDSPMSTDGRLHTPVPEDNPEVVNWRVNNLQVLEFVNLPETGGLFVLSSSRWHKSVFETNTRTFSLKVVIPLKSVGRLPECSGNSNCSTPSSRNEISSFLTAAAAAAAVAEPNYGL